MELYILLSFMIFAAIVAMEVKDLFSSIIAVGAVGFCLCLAFLILKAPDLAVTQLVVELLCLIILVRATIKRDFPLVIQGRWVFNTISSLVFALVFISFAYSALKDLPDFGNPTMSIVKKYLEEGIAKTGATNLVSAVILDFRAYDTLGEVAILFGAIVGIMTVLRKTKNENRQDKIDE